jgi:hypothetical protein
MHGVIPPLPNTSSLHGCLVNHKDNFTVYNKLCGKYKSCSLNYFPYFSAILTQVQIFKIFFLNIPHLRSFLGLKTKFHTHKVKL